MKTLAIAFFLSNGKNTKVIDGITYLDNGKHSVRNWRGQKKEFVNENIWDAKMYLYKQIQTLENKGYKISK